MIKTLSLLMIGTMSFWLVLAWPIYYFLGGSSGMMLSGAAALLCLVPTTLTLAWGLWAFRSQPEMQFLAVMGGTAVRLAFVIGVALALYFLVPAFQYQRFWLWIVAFYLFTLALEMVLLTRHISTQQGPQVQKLLSPASEERGLEEGEKPGPPPSAPFPREEGEGL